MWNMTHRWDISVQTHVKSEQMHVKLINTHLGCELEVLQVVFEQIIQACSLHLNGHLNSSLECRTVHLACCKAP